MPIDIRSSLRHPLDDADIVTRTLWASVGRPLSAAVRAMGIGPRLLDMAAALMALATATFWWNGWQGAGLATAFLALGINATGADDDREASGSRIATLVLMTLCWIGWTDGMGAAGQPLERMFGITLVALLVFAGLARILVQAGFYRRHGFDLHLWRGVDRFASLFLSSPAIDWTILAACWLAGRPLLGIELVAMWTVLSLLYERVRAAMANDLKRRGRPVARGV